MLLGRCFLKLLPTAACGLTVGIEDVEEPHEPVGVVFCPFGQLVARQVEAHAAGTGFTSFQLFATDGYRIDAVIVSVGFGELVDDSGIDTALHLYL